VKPTGDAGLPGAMSKPSEPRSWEASEEGREYVKRELLRSGVSFEALIASDCRRFATVYDERDLRVEAGRLLYGNDADIESPLREVDQFVQLYDEIDLAGVLGVQFILHVVIECKTRSGLSCFGFQVDEREDGWSALVVASDLALSSHLLEVTQRPVELINEQLHAISLLTDPSGRGQPKVSEEALVYKAAASLMDFVEADAGPATCAEADRAMAEIGICAEFNAYIEEKRYGPEYVAPDWLHDRLDKYRDAFAASYHGGRKLYHGLSIYCPVVCLDAPLYHVELDVDGGITDLEPRDFLLTGIRPAGWPHRMRPIAPRLGPEAVVVVTHRAGLHRVLPVIHKWFSEASTMLADIDEAEARKSLLEGAFLGWVSRNAGRRGNYRSDLAGY
jgi:hypothetical protein